MTRHPDSPAGDARQSDRLDAFLDALAHGNPAMPPRDLDPTLATTVRHVHSLAGESVAADIRRAGKAQRWEDLMRHNVAHATVTPFPTITLPSSSSSSAPAMAPPRPAVQRSWLRRLGGQSLGLVATLTLVLLVATSGLAVYLSAPRGGDEPTMLPAAFGATPEGTPFAERQNPRVTIQRCDVVPMSFDAIMGILAVPIENRIQPPNTTQLTLPLPDGPPLDRLTEATLTLLTGTYLGCATYPEMAALRTDDGIYRLFTSEVSQHGSLEFGFLNGDLIAQAWLQRDDTGLSDLAPVGQPSPFVLTKFRQLADGRVAAYLSRSFSLDADGTLTTSSDGYIVFAQEDGRWLIDDFGPSAVG